MFWLSFLPAVSKGTSVLCGSCTHIYVLLHTLSRVLITITWKKYYAILKMKGTEIQKTKKVGLALKEIWDNLESEVVDGQNVCHFINWYCDSYSFHTLCWEPGKAALQRKIGIWHLPKSLSFLNTGSLGFLVNLCST